MTIFKGMKMVGVLTLATISKAFPPSPIDQTLKTTQNKLESKG